LNRLPNNKYYPKEWAEHQDFILKDEKISLNNIPGKSSPYAISPQVAEFTKKFGEEIANLPSPQERALWHVDWMGEYKENGSSHFIPENRWTHEVVQPPIKIKDNLYQINVSADIYIKLEHKKFIINNFEKEDISLKFISRTLHTYLTGSEDIIPEAYINKDWILTQYYWQIRWLPKKNAILTFYTTPDIEEYTLAKTPVFVIDCNQSIEGYINVPVMFKKEIYGSVPYIKHDTPILYMEVEEYE
jgi:hypothetical protein